MVSDGACVWLCAQNMFKHAWKGYREFAWGKDTLKPVSKKGDDNFLGMAITMVDSLDTMLIMGLNDEFNSARDWIATNMKLGAQVRVWLWLWLCVCVWLSFVTTRSCGAFNWL